jgi:methionyl-tRNA synthetase
MTEKIFANSLGAAARVAKDVNPLNMVKEGNAQSAIELLYDAAEALRIIAILILPVVTTSGAWNFRSAELEDGLERKRRTVLTRRRGVGEIAGRIRRRQTSAALSAD